MKTGRYAVLAGLGLVVALSRAAGRTCTSTGRHRRSRRVLRKDRVRRSARSPVFAVGSGRVHERTGRIRSTQRHAASRERSFSELAPRRKSNRVPKQWRWWAGRDLCDQHRRNERGPVHLGCLPGPGSTVVAGRLEDPLAERASGRVEHLRDERRWVESDATHLHLECREPAVVARRPTHLVRRLGSGVGCRRSHDGRERVEPGAADARLHASGQCGLVAGRVEDRVQRQRVPRLHSRVEMSMSCDPMGPTWSSSQQDSGTICKRPGHRTGVGSSSATAKLCRRSRNLLPPCRRICMSWIPTEVRKSTSPSHRLCTRLAPIGEETERAGLGDGKRSR